MSQMGDMWNLYFVLSLKVKILTFEYTQAKEESFQDQPIICLITDQANIITESFLYIFSASTSFCKR